MSEQLSFPAGAGLLSLNLSVLPQGVPPVGGSGLQSAMGFGALMGKAQTQGQSGLPGVGVTLPPAGVALPPELAEQLPQDELMQQRLLQLAKMLEQNMPQEGEMPEQLASELAKALRRYSEEGAVLPPVEGMEAGSEAEAEALPPVTESVAAAAPVSDLPDSLITSTGDVAQENTETSVVGIEPVEGDPVVSVGLGAAMDTAEPPQPTVTDRVNSREVRAEKSVPPEIASAQVVLPDTGKENHPLDRVPPGAAISQERRSDKAGEHPHLAQQAVGSAVRPERGEISRSHEKAEVAGSMAAQAQDARAKSPDAVTQSIAGRVVAEERRIPGAEQLVSRPEAKTEPQTVAGSVPESRSADKAATESAPLQRRSDNLAPVSPQSPAEQQVRLAQENGGPEVNNVGRRFEASLDAAQQLLQKVAVSEKPAESLAAVSRGESASSIYTGTSQSLSQPTATQKTVTEGHTLMMPNQARFNTPAWSNALGERAVWVAAQSSRVAEIRLDPPELGSLNVRVQVSQDQVSLNFTSPHAHVRDAVEQSLPRLREMFAEQGLALNDSSVSDQSSDQQRRSFEKGGDNPTDYRGQVAAGEQDEVLPEGARSMTLVDYRV